MPIRILRSHREKLNVNRLSVSRDQAQLQVSLLSRRTAPAQVVFETLDIFSRNEIRKRPLDQFVRIFAKQLSSGNVDLFNHAVFVKARIADRRKIVQVRISHA